MKKVLIITLLIGIGFINSQCLLFKPSAKKMTRRALKAHPQFDVVVVPGIQFVEPAWDRVLQMRLIWAKHLYDRGFTKNIIVSGNSVYTPYVEAKIMKQYLVAMGVPEQHVFEEYKAEHSTENVWYGNLLAKKEGFNSVAVASDPFQSKMLYRFVKKRTKGVYFLPVIFDTLRGLPHDTPVIAYKELKISNFIPINERESKRKRFKGTMGRNIDYDKLEY